jgi:PAS domain S-box-containing protein
MLQAVFDSIPDLVVVYDEDGRYLEVLTGHQVLSFASPKQLIGRTVTDLLEDETATTILDGIEEALSTGDVTTVEYRIELAGQTFWFEGRIAPVEPADPSEDPDRVVFVARDISQQRKHEQELQRRNERLDRFASTVGHDLRNPLNVLEGSLELAEETGDQEYFEKCRWAIDRMQHLIDDILTFAREGEELPDPGPVDLAALAEDSWRMVETSTSTVRIETDRTVRADETRLKQLMENLFRNAVEHGGQDVTVTLDDLDDDGFFVADDGPGIPAGECERVMDRGTSGRSDGTGIGLAIVREVADAHGWSVTVAEGPEGGTRFEFRGVEEGATRFDDQGE